MTEERCTLPISHSHDQIIETIEQNSVVVIRGETGSGKTTQVPQFLLDHYIKQGRGAECNIIITQVGALYCEIYVLNFSLTALPVLGMT